jgi:hypothetical protein
MATVAFGTSTKYTDFHTPLENVLAAPVVALDEFVVVYLVAWCE